MTLIDQRRLAATAQTLIDTFPDLHTLAVRLAAGIVRQHTGRVLDPEQIYWHRFDRAASSPRTFTGWEHWGRPVESLSLLQLMYRRFAAADQDSLDNLQVMGGFYTADQHQGRYDESNELRMLASEVAADFWKNDFSSLYHRQLQGFWVQQGNAFVVLAKILFLSEVAKAQRLGWLERDDLRTLQHGLASRLKPPISLANLAKTAPATAGIQVHDLAVSGFVARDVLRVVSSSGRQILYLPGDTQSLRVFTDVQAVRRWLREQVSSPGGNALLRHFSAFSLLQTPDLASLREALLDPAGVTLDSTAPIVGDAFIHLRDKARDEMRRQADHLLTSNAHLREQLWVGYLGAFISLASSAAPLAWPVALIVVGASIANVVLNAKLAIQAPDAGQRKTAIVNAVLSAINAVFNLPFVFAGRVPLEPLDVDATPLPADPAGTPDASLDGEQIALVTLPAADAPLPRGAYRNSLGMIERTDVAYVYRVRELLRGEDPARALREGFAPTRRFDCAKPMIEGRALMTFGSARGAIHYAQAAFDGNYVLYEIDAQGIPSASLCENLSANTVFTLAREGYPEDFIEQRLAEGRSLNDFANDGWLYDEVHVAADHVEPSRIRLITSTELEPVAQALGAWQPRLGSTSLLRGVKVRGPGGGRFVTEYFIDIEGYPQKVRYDPYTASWRTRNGKGWRYNVARLQFAQVSDLAAEPRPSAQHMEAALGELGINVRFELEMPPLSTAPERPLPRKVHSIWLGRAMPRRFINQVLDNAELAASGSDPFDTHLYLGIENSAERAATVRRLMGRVPRLKLHRLEDTEFFQSLRRSPYYAQYVAASTGNGINYASAVDVLRYRLLAYEGGFYLDVDDSIRALEAGEPSFADRPWAVREGELLLNNLVRHQRLGMVMDFNNSNFASLPNNPLLERISEQSLARFRASTDLYESRPYESSDAREDLEAYGRRISGVSGPGVFNAVIDQELPAFRQYRGLARIAQDEIYLSPERLQALRTHMQVQTTHYSPLGGVIQIGTTGSWMRTR